jgi:hypothetical protein
VNDHAQALAEGIEAALPAWVERSVARIMTAATAAATAPASPSAGAARSVWAGVAAAARAAGARAAGDVGPQVRALLDTDIDQQWTTPLAIVRAAAVAYPTEVLRDAGVAPVGRDAFAVERFPDDPYDLTPASFADLAPELGPLGIAWGAAKAFEHKTRHGRPDPTERTGGQP